MKVLFNMATPESVWELMFVLLNIHNEGIAYECNLFLDILTFACSDDCLL